LIVATEDSRRSWRRRVLKSYENRKVTKNGEEAENDGGAVQTPRKAQAGRKKKGTDTPQSKKRKLSEATTDDNEVEEAVDDVKAEADDQDNADGGNIG
jgi:hypothetical protein